MAVEIGQNHNIHGIVVVSVLLLEVSVDWQCKRLSTWTRILHLLQYFFTSLWTWSICWWQRLINTNTIFRYTRQGRWMLTTSWGDCTGGYVLLALIIQMGHGKCETLKD
jgi:hypothetical protein